MKEKKNIIDFLAKNAPLDNSWKKEAAKRIANEDWLDDSFTVALNILRILREKQKTQDWLSKELKLSPQYINKIVKGDVNLSLKTISKIGKVLGYKLISVPIYDKVKENVVNYKEQVAKRYSSNLFVIHSNRDKMNKQSPEKDIYTKVGESMKKIGVNQAI